MPEARSHPGPRGHPAARGPEPRRHRLKPSPAQLRVPILEDNTDAEVPAGTRRLQAPRRGGHQPRSPGFSPSLLSPHCCSVSSPGDAGRALQTAQGWGRRGREISSALPLRAFSKDDFTHGVGTGCCAPHMVPPRAGLWPHVPARVPLHTHVRSHESSTGGDSTRKSWALQQIKWALLGRKDPLPPPAASSKPVINRKLLRAAGPSLSPHPGIPVVCEIQARKTNRGRCRFCSGYFLLFVATLCLFCTRRRTPTARSLLCVTPGSLRLDAAPRMGIK